MITSGISSIDPSVTTPSTTDARGTVRQLFSAIESGDLTTAQQAFNTLSQQAPTGPLQNSAIGQDFSAIGTALASGSVSDAQQALTKLQADLQAAHGKRHHQHHHHHGGQAASSGTPETQVPDPNDPTTLVGSTLSVKA